MAQVILFFPAPDDVLNREYGYNPGHRRKMNSNHPSAVVNAPENVIIFQMH